MVTYNDIRAVELTEEECNNANNIATRRQSGKEQFSSTRNWRRNEYTTSLGVHLIGALGEVAVAKYLGWSLDTAMRIDGDAGQDFECCGWRVDVQTASYSPPHLKFDREHPFRADIAILVCKQKDARFDIYGWISKEEFSERCEPADYGYGARSVIKDIGALKPIDDLISTCKSQPKKTTA